MVHSILDEAGCLAILNDQAIEIATMEIFDEGKNRTQVQREIAAKEKAIERLALKYSRFDVPPELLRQCLYSIGDNHSFLRYSHCI